MLIFILNGVIFLECNTIYELHRCILNCYTLTQWQKGGQALYPPLPIWLQNILENYWFSNFSRNYTFQPSNEKKIQFLTVVLGEIKKKILQFSARIKINI